MSGSEEVIETKTTFHSRSPEGIFISRMKENAMESLEDAYENGKTLLNLKGGDPKLPILVDFSKAAGQESGARKFYAENSGKWCTKAAILVSSPVSKVMGNIYMGLNKPIVPTRLFTQESEAIAWLKAQ